MVELYHGLLHRDDARIVHAYETWGFRGLTRELIEVLNIWARFIYGPLLDDRVRTVADGVTPANMAGARPFSVHQALKQKGPVTVPREFVFMDRAAIGLGAVFLHLRAELNFHRLFDEAIEDFSSPRSRSARTRRSPRRAGRLAQPADRRDGARRRCRIALRRVLLSHRMRICSPISEDRMADRRIARICDYAEHDAHRHEGTSAIFT